VPPDRRETTQEVSFMGALPPIGFFARHARRIQLKDVTFATEAPDARPAIVFEDVKGAIVDGLVSQRSRSEAVVARDSSGIAVGDVRSFG
jgi:hypothetical protein